MTALAASTGRLTRRTARSLTDEVKRDVAALREKLLRLYEGEAHIALGYSSWKEYWSAEFETAWQTGYRELEAARVDRVVHQLANGPLPESHARRLAPLLRDEGEEAVVEVYRSLREEYGDQVTAERIGDMVGARLYGARRTGHLLSSTSQEWYTPQVYIEAAHEVLGGIDLDPASSPLANETVRARRYYTAAQDGLTKRWRGRVWLNPPYSDGDGRSLAALFVRKLLDEYEAGNVTAAIMLLNGHRTDARWFRPLWDHPLCFATEGRFPFLNPEREDGGRFRPSIVPVFAYIGRDFDRFREVFGEREPPIGRVVKDPSDRGWQKRWSSPPS